MKVFKVILLILISIIVVLSTWIYLFATTVEMTALSSRYYKTLLVDKGVARDLHAELGDMLLQIMVGDMSGEDEKMPQAAINALLTAFDASWLEQKLPPLFDDFVMFVKGNHDQLVLTVDLTDRKELFRETLRSDIMAYVLKMPGADSIDLIVLDDMTDEIIKGIDLPDQIDLSDMLGETLLTEENQQVIDQVRRVRTIFLVVPYIVLALFFFFCCLLAKLGGGLKWFGSSLCISSGLFALGLIVARFIAVPLLLQSLQHDAPIDLRILETALTHALNRAFIVPVIVFGAGVLFIVIGIIIKKKMINRSVDAKSKEEAVSQKA